MQSIPLDFCAAAAMWPHREVWVQPGLPVLIGDSLVTVYRDRDADDGRHAYRLMIERPAGAREEAIAWGDLHWMPEDDAVIALCLEDHDAVALRVYHARTAATHLH